MPAADPFPGTVVAVNDAPTITAPAGATTNEDTSTTFAASNRISVADVDANGGVERVDLGATHGTLTLGQTTGQKILFDLRSDIANAVAAGTALDDDEIVSFAPQLGILSSRHAFQYSRIFRS